MRLHWPSFDHMCSHVGEREGETTRKAATAAKLVEKKEKGMAEKPHQTASEVCHLNCPMFQNWMRDKTQAVPFLQKSTALVMFRPSSVDKLKNTENMPPQDDAPPFQNIAHGGSFQHCTWLYLGLPGFT